MRPLSICVLGGTGFVGRHLVCRLIRDGHHVRILTRDRFLHRDLTVLPGLELVDADVHDATALAAALGGQEVAINLVGILNERGHDGRGFLHAHTRLASTLVAACRAAGVPRLLQMSSLRAAVDAPSHYLRSKALAEQAIRDGAGATLAWTIFRPSVIFGRGDSFLNRFAALLALAPVLPLARAAARFQPVWIGDVVEAMVRTLARADSIGATYELGGPDIVTLAGVVRYVGELTGRRRPLIALPDSLGRLQAALLEYFPGKPLSLDNFHSLQLDSVCTDDGCGRLGIVPAALGAVVPSYLGDGRRAVLPREPAGVPA